MKKGNFILSLILSLLACSGPKEQASQADSVALKAEAATATTTPRVPSNAFYKDGMYYIKPTLEKGFEYNADAEKESKRMRALQRQIEKGEIEFADLPENDQLGVDELSQSGDYWSIGVSPVPQWIDEYPPSKVWASSTLPSSKNTNYEVANLMDYDLRTVWSEGATGSGVGEFIAFQFPAHNQYRNETVLTSITIINGFVKSNELWKKNSRVKTFRLFINDKPFAFLDVEDSHASQTFDLGSISSPDGFTLKFEITEVYPGDVYEDVVISYFDFYGDGVLCVGGATQIALADGSFKSIASIEIGDEIITWDASNQCTSSARVETIGQAYHNNLVEIDLGFTSLLATEDHPLVDIDNQLRAVKPGKNSLPLKVGDKLQTYFNQDYCVASIQAIRPIAGMRLTFAITKTSNNQPYLANGTWIAVESD
jgi:hypothetical protein